MEAIKSSLTEVEIDNLCTLLEVIKIENQHVYTNVSPIPSPLAASARGCKELGKTSTATLTRAFALTILV